MSKTEGKESEEMKWRKKLLNILEVTYLDPDTIIGLFNHLIGELFNLFLNKGVGELPPHEDLEPPDGSSEVHHHLVFGRQSHGALLATVPNNRTEQERNSEAC